MDTFRVRGQVLRGNCLTTTPWPTASRRGRTRGTTRPSRPTACLLPGQTANGLNFTASSRGINGLFVDLTPPAGRYGGRLRLHGRQRQRPRRVAAAPAPASITVRGAPAAASSSRPGTNGRTASPSSGRTARSATPGFGSRCCRRCADGLITSDVFYFGNLVGSILRPAVDGRAVVGADDVRLPRASLDSPTADMRADHNRDRRVNALDLAIVRRNLGASLRMIAPPAAAAPTVAGGVARSGARCYRDGRPVRRGC